MGLSRKVSHMLSMIDMKHLLLTVLMYLDDDNFCTREDALEDALKLLEFMSEYENMEL